MIMSRYHFRNMNAAGNPSLDHRLRAKVAADLGRQVAVDHVESRCFFSISLTQNIFDLISTCPLINLEVCRF